MRVPSLGGTPSRWPALNLDPPNGYSWVSGTFLVVCLRWRRDEAGRSARLFPAVLRLCPLGLVVRSLLGVVGRPRRIGRPTPRFGSSKTTEMAGKLRETRIQRMPFCAAGECAVVIHSHQNDIASTLGGVPLVQAAFPGSGRHLRGPLVPALLPRRVGHLAAVSGQPGLDHHVAHRRGVPDRRPTDSHRTRTAVGSTVLHRRSIWPAGSDATARRAPTSGSSRVCAPRLAFVAR